MRQSSGTFRVSTLVGCLVAQLCVGIIYLWSVFKADAMSYYGWGDGPVNMVASFMLFCFCAGNLLGGALQDRTNPRLSALIGILLFGGGILLSSLIPATGSIVLFYITYCVMGGLGSGFVYGSALNCLQKWLPHRRGLATGLAASTFGLSTVVFSPVCSWLLGAMPMPMALRTLAGVLFVIGFVATLFISLPDGAYLSKLKLPGGGSGGGERSMTTTQAMVTLPFWCLFLSMFLFNATWNMLTPLIKGLGMERGLSEGLAVLAVSLTGLTNAAGRLFMSTLSDKIGRIATLNILCVVTLACALLLIFAGGPLYLVVVLVTAFAYGGPAAVNPALCTDLFGPKYSGTNYGVAMLSLGLSSVVFNAISNVLYAASDAYVATFVMGGVTAVLAMALVLIIGRYAKRAKAAV